MEQIVRLENEIQVVSEELRIADPTAVDELVREAKLPGDESERYRETLHRGLHFRKAAGQLAASAKQSVSRINATVALLTMAASAAAALGIVYLPKSGVPAAVEFVLVLVLLLVGAKNRRDRLQSRWVRCRFLAEFGRVALYVLPLGVELQSIVDRVKKSLPAESNPPEHLVGLLQQRFQLEGHTPSTGASKQYGALFLDLLESQRVHHTRGSKQKRLTDGTASNLMLCIFIGAVAATGIAASSSFNWLQLSGPVMQLLQFLSIILPVIGAAVFLWGVQREDSRMSRRSGQMVRQIAKRMDSIRTAKTDQERQDSIIEAAEMLTLESYEWSVLMNTAVC